MDANHVYDLSMTYSQQVWDLVKTWPNFARDTIGKQVVRSADSVSANLREGMGRYHFKDRNIFNIYSRGSLFETHCWIQKAYERNLISKETFDKLNHEYAKILVQLNIMIKNNRSQT